MNRRPMQGLLSLLLVAVALSTVCCRKAQGQPPATPNPPAQPPKPAPKKEEPPKWTPGGKYHQYDMKRPQPTEVDPGDAALAGAPPADAVVLFDGTDLSKWVKQAPGNPPATWKVENGYMEISPKGGAIQTKDLISDGADIQYHMEWATPAEVKGSSQGRGNSGLFIGDCPEIQVLDSYHNPTYPEGSASGLYFFYPPLVNASRKPGEWQSYDVFLELPRFENGKKVRPAYLTVFHNGIVVHNHVMLENAPGEDGPDYVHFSTNATKLRVALQDHGNPIRFRNIWVRKTGSYDAGAATTTTPAPKP